MSTLIIISVPDGEDAHTVAAAAALGLIVEPLVSDDVTIRILTEEQHATLFDGLDSGADDYAYRASFEASFESDEAEDGKPMADVYQDAANAITKLAEELRK